MKRSLKTVVMPLMNKIHLNSWDGLTTVVVHATNEYYINSCGILSINCIWQVVKETLGQSLKVIHFWLVGICTVNMKGISMLRSLHSFKPSCDFMLKIHIGNPSGDFGWNILQWQAFYSGFDSSLDEVILEVFDVLAGGLVKEKLRGIR